MRRLVLLVGCCAASASADQTPAGFRAVGTDSAWALVIDDARIHFLPADGPSVSVRMPRRQDDEIGWSYETPKLSVHAFDGGCDRGETGERYRHKVGVRVGNREYEGCGGERLPDGSLWGTSWMVTNIAGAEVRGPGFAIDFHPQASFIAYTGCKRVDGNWRQEGDRLVMTPTGSTVATCRDPVGGCERRLLQILTQPMTVGYKDRRTAVLTAETGSVTLWKPGDEDDLFETRVSPCPALR
ncbi:MAG TPA: META domain-containing protein [Allosphingosinicella sp.]